MRAVHAVGTALLLAGCAGLGSGPGASGGAGGSGSSGGATGPGGMETAPARAATGPVLLRRAEDQIGAGQYRSALGLYDEFLRAHPNDPAAPRVRATRNVVERLLLSQAEIERLRRDADSRQAEIDRLKADLERLRRIDLRPPPASP